MTTQITSKKQAKGLNTYENSVTAERGDTRLAVNTVIVRKGLMSNRPGFEYYVPDTDGTINNMLEYSDYLIDHLDDNTLGRRTQSSSTRVNYTGTYVAPTNYKIHGTTTQRNFYFCTTAGIFRLDSPTSEPIKAGTPEALDLQAQLDGIGGGFLSGSTKVAYKMVWVRTDSNGLVTRGKPTVGVDLTNASRLSVTSITRASTTATVTTASSHGYSNGDTVLVSGADQSQYNGQVAIANVGANTFDYTVSGSPTTPATGTITVEKQLDAVVTFTAPFDVKSGDKYEVYRTIQTSDASIIPGDEYYLVEQDTFTGTPGTVVSFTDSIGDEFLNTPLYTNPDSGEGATSANYRPPFATDIEQFNGITFYANTAIDDQSTINLISVLSLVDNTSAIRVTRINGGTSQNYVFDTAENVATRRFKRYTAGDVSANIESTMRSFCRVVNQDADGLVYAEYLSGPSDDPGKVRLWVRDKATGSFAVSANNSTTGNNFLPSLPTTGTDYLSQNDRRQNRVYYSKPDAPDSVPLLNYVDVGSETKPIERIVALRSTLFILKQDGVYMIQGAGPTYGNAITLDNTAIIAAPESTAVLSNYIYMFSNQGFIRLNENGAVIISIDIEPDVMSKLPQGNVRSVSHAYGDEFRRQYVCWLPDDGNATYGTIAYVYHIIPEEWTTWDKPAGASIVSGETRNVFITSGREEALLKLRTGAAVSDYSDEQFDLTLTQQTGRVVRLDWTANPLFQIDEGYSLHQSGRFAKIVDYQFVTGSTYDVTVDRDITFTVGTVEARTPIYSHFQFPADPCGEAGITKLFQSITVYLDQGKVSKATIQYATNEMGQVGEFEVMPNTSSVGWGQSAWGIVEWGDAVSPVYSVPYTITIPSSDMSGESLMMGWKHSVSNEVYRIGYVSFTFETAVEYRVVQ
ncbi:hypothetical protein [Ferrovibrio sp.]|uniref:hypothetical protein n=1 Tax=Ferrovibrio sp. TaxID=1917215 RepID=UPI000CC7642F|nr:hypothetical protein [Ferrovibrio sp.]PJI40411.1 MAG: hypothetical protein CTR53_10395 [Ferrovibrio sp.]